MSDNFDRTMQVVTNLDRPGIENKLKQARQLAEALGLEDVKKILTGIEGKSRQQLQDTINQACNGLIGKNEYAQLQDLLELAELNLPNIK